MTVQKIDPKAGFTQLSGSGTPEGNVAAYVGRFYLDTSNNSIYYKFSGDNTNTDWALISDNVFPEGFLTTSLSAYGSASTGQWIEITNTEYDAIQNDAATETIGTLNTNMRNGSLSNFGGGLTYTFAKNYLPSVKSQASIWCFKFYVGSTAMGGVNKVKARVSGTTLVDLGSLPASTKTNDFAYFIKKGGSSSLVNPYLAAVLSSSNFNMYFDVGGTAGYWSTDDRSSTVNMVNSFDWGIQGLVRTF